MAFAIKYPEHGGWRGRDFEAACVGPCRELSIFTEPVALPHVCWKCKRDFPGLAARVRDGREPRPVAPRIVVPRLPFRMKMIVRRFTDAERAAGTR